MDFRIINCGTVELDKLMELENKCFPDPWTVDMFRSQLPDQHHCMYAAEMNGKLVGYICMTHVLDEGDISNVAADPDYRRMGIGDALVGRMLKKAEELGLATVMLEVRQSNTPAKKLYEKHGFVPVGIRKNYYDMPKENAVLMSKNMK